MTRLPRASVGWSAACLIASCLVVNGQSSAPSQAASPPIPIFKMDAQYPAAARKAGIGGTATFSAEINPNGSVRSVTVVSIPENGAGLGFEQEVERAVSQWRFEPASLAGAAVAGTYTGSITFELTIPGEMIYPVSSAAAWKAVQKFMGDLHLFLKGREKRDREQIYVGTTNYDGNGFPSLADLGLPTHLVPMSVELHMYVAPGFEPARVAVGALIAAATRPEVLPPSRKEQAPPRPRQGYMYYGTAPMAKWLHAKLAAMLGVTPEALSARGQLERAAQAQRLLPGGLPTACRNTPPLPDDQPRLLEDLKVIYRHRPQYGPKMADAAREAAGKDTVFTFAGEVTEHGTLAYSRPASVHSGGQRPVNTSTLQEALQVAQQAAYLSRWEPVVIDTCPVSVPVRIRVQF